MAANMHLKAESIKGESEIKGHEGETQILAWSWGASQSGSAHEGKGITVGKVSVQDISITKYVDAGSTDLFKLCCSGKALPNVTITMDKVDGSSSFPYVTLTLKECLISSVSLGGSGAEERQTENVTLNFATFEYKYQGQDATGKKSTPTTCTFDIRANAMG
jgi:type VI secretion system secreted protein Hcp